LCAIAGILMIVHMIKVVIRDQDAKRRGIVPGFREPADREEVVA
jgi:hypothetical protein